MDRYRCSTPARAVFSFLLVLLCQFGLEGISARNLAFASGIEILTPPSGATIVGRHAEAHLVVRRPHREGSQVWVEANERRVDPAVVREILNDNYLHFRLPLQPNLNSFTIHPGAERLVINYRPVRAALNPNTLGSDVYLFHRNGQLPHICAQCHDLQKTTPVEPVGLRAQESCASCHRNLLEQSPWQHSTSVNKQCLACHQQFAQPFRVGFPTGKIEETCVACHTGKKDWRSRKSIHGPMVAGGCTLCHNPHGDKNRYQLWAGGASDLCIACHSDMESLIQRNGARFTHGILHGPKGCVSCHDPHASDHEAILHDSINELCVSCHQGYVGIRRGHPVGGHPVEGPSERRRPGRKLTCVSCHDPHGSSYRYILFADGRGGHVCSRCHR